MNYKKIGLKCGIEIHQRLKGKKLFCSCSGILRDDQPHFTVKRKLRASAGESGEIDIAAKQEQFRDRTFIYEGYHDTTCLVELDEEPPHEINQEALYTVLQFCKLVNSDVNSIVQVMRKTVVDGSNTAGFQRTALVARKGEIDTPDGKVRLMGINIEEEAAKIISESSEEKVYRLDRLGIPLIEIGTEPDIHTPDQCQECSKKLGMFLRSLPGVERGLGTIRQDINISIKGGNRIEVKGFQDLKMIPILIELEVKRQLELLKIKEELRNVRLNELKVVDLSTLLQDCQSKIVKDALEKNGKVLGIKLNSFAGFLGRELQPDYRLGTEFSGRAKIIAGVKGLFHSDELPNYGITEVVRIRKKLCCDPKDAFIIVADEEKKARKALEAVYERAKEVLIGVPKEVRKGHPDGKTSYLRPIPGAARMYPETDVPLIYPDTSKIKLPELLEEKIKRFQEDYGLSADLATFMARSDKLNLFEELVERYGTKDGKKNAAIKPAFIAETLGPTLIEIKRKYNLDPEKLTEDDFRELFKYLASDKINKDIVIDVLIDMIKGKFNLKNYESISTEDIEKDIQKIVDENKKAPMGALMGICMKKFAGKASGKIIAETLKRVLES